MSMWHCGTASQPATIVVSWRLSRFLRKAPKRTSHSSSNETSGKFVGQLRLLWFPGDPTKLKYVQNKFSMILALERCHSCLSLSTSVVSSVSFTFEMWKQKWSLLCKPNQYPARFLHARFPIYKASSLNFLSLSLSLIVPYLPWF